MLTTKGIIESVEKAGTYIQYKVRLPLFHEVDGVSVVTNSELPVAIYPLPPHMGETMLSVGDIVECSLEDGSLDNIVILGLIPETPKDSPYKGSNNTASKTVIKQVETLQVWEKGKAVLPLNTMVRTDDGTSPKLIDNPDSKRNYVNGKEIATLKGITTFNRPIVELIKELQESVEYLMSLTEVEVHCEELSVGESSIQGKQDETPSTESYEHVAFIGDSRIDEMKRRSSENKQLPQGVQFITKWGEGWDWFNETAIPEFNSIKSGITDCLIHLGGNDVYKEGAWEEEWNPSYRSTQFADKIKELAQQNPGIRFYFVTCGIVDASYIREGRNWQQFNEGINTFDNLMKQKLNGCSIGIIDYRTYLGTEFETTDGIHYTDQTTDRLFKWVMEHVFRGG